MNFLTRNLSLLVFGLLINMGLCAQKVKFNKGRSVVKNYYTEVAYQELKGKLIIPVQIEGETYQFLFDTGAPNLISHTLHKKIRTKELNKISVKDANDSKRFLEVVEIPLLEISGLAFKNSPAIVNDPNSNFLFECFEIHGIIGSNLLRNSIVQIDSRKQQLTITDQLEKLDVKEVRSLDMALSKGQSSPYIWIGLKEDMKTREQVLFDTGAEGFYDMSFNSFEALDSLQVFGKVQTALGYKGLGLFGVAESSLHYRVLVSEIVLPGVVFENVVSISTTAMKSRIGSDILEHGIVTLNYKDRKFYFEPFSQRVDLGEEVWGFSPTMKDGTLVVGLVWNEELEKRVQYGDEIIQLNGLKVAETDECTLLLRESPLKMESSIHIVLKDSMGLEQVIDLKKKQLKP